MFKHFQNVETYLSQHYRVEGFPLDWVVQSTLPAIGWSMVETARAQSKVRNQTSSALRRLTTSVATLQVLCLETLRFISGVMT